MKRNRGAVSAVRHGEGSRKICGFGSKTSARRFAARCAGGKTLMAFALVWRDTPVFEEIAELRRASAAHISCAAFR